MKTAIFLLVGMLLITAANAAEADSVAKGRALYLQYCASCHGLSGEGNGPMARVLTTPPANLRRLSERYGNPLPENQIARFIDGRTDVKTHGPRDMPVWGKRFYAETQGNERLVKRLIAQLVAYLQSIQTGARTVLEDRCVRGNQPPVAEQHSGAREQQALGPTQRGLHLDRSNLAILRFPHGVADLLHDIAELYARQAVLDSRLRYSHSHR